VAVAPPCISSLDPYYVWTGGAPRPEHELEVPHQTPDPAPLRDEDDLDAADETTASASSSGTSSRSPSFRPTPARVKTPTGSKRCSSGLPG